MGVADTVGHQTIRQHIISYPMFGPKFGDFGDFGFSEGGGGVAATQSTLPFQDPQLS